MVNSLKQKPLIKQKKITKTQLAKEMNVSRAMLYYQHKRPLIDLEVKNQIEAVILTKGKESYGHKRIALEPKLNKKRILRVMKKFNIKPYKRRRKAFIKKDDFNKPETIYTNLIKNQCPIAPNIFWVCDFTYIQYKYKFIYLATVLDLYTREIVGFNISRFHSAMLVCGALNDAGKYTNNNLPEIIHSDQGSEYDSQQHITLVESLGIKISMSKKSSPWENGYQESFFAQFKLDLGDTSRFEQLGELLEEIQHIIWRHNNVKMHSVLKTTPVNFKRLWDERISNFMKGTHI